MKQQCIQRMSRNQYAHCRASIWSVLIDKHKGFLLPVKNIPQRKIFLNWLDLHNQMSIFISRFTDFLGFLQLQEAFKKIYKVLRNFKYNFLPVIVSEVMQNIRYKLERRKANRLLRLISFARAKILHSFMFKLTFREHLLNFSDICVETL